MSSRPAASSSRAANGATCSSSTGRSRTPLEPPLLTPIDHRQHGDTWIVARPGRRALPCRPRPHGAVDATTSEKQALTDRDAGALLLRDAGSPADTRWIDEREDLPKIIRAGRHIARTKRYIRNYAHEIEPDELVAYVAQEASRGDGWVKLVGDWIDRDAGDLAPAGPRRRSPRPSPRPTSSAPGSPRTASPRTRCPTWSTAGIDCIEHATGLTDET